MKIFRIILLALATALFAVNFWTIDYQDPWAKASLWAYFRIFAALVLAVLLVRFIQADNVGKKSRKQ